MVLIRILMSKSGFEDEVVQGTKPFIIIDQLHMS
jgi:hypothetical protein